MRLPHSLQEYSIQACKLVLLALLVPGATGCSSESVISPPFLNPIFEPTSTTPVANQIRLAENNIIDNEVYLDVLIEGPTTSTDIYSLAFDLVLGNTTVVEYIANSAVAGPALTVSGPQGIEVLATQNGNRVVVGLTKTNGGSGNGIAAGFEVLLTLTFRVKTSGISSICLAGSQGSCVNPQMGPAALDSMGNEITSIRFDDDEAAFLAL